jgi:drug/metabolite transporter superfamily protein YnfA
LEMGMVVLSFLVRFFGCFAIWKWRRRSKQ